MRTGNIARACVAAGVNNIGVKKRGWKKERTGKGSTGPFREIRCKGNTGLGTEET